MSKKDKEFYRDLAKKKRTHAEALLDQYVKTVVHRRRADLSYVIQDFDWEKDTAPKLEIYFCHSSGLTSVKLSVACGQQHEDNIAISEGDTTETVKELLQGYIDIFTSGLESLERAPQ